MTAFPDVIGERLKFRESFYTRRLPMGELHRQRHRKFIRPRHPFDLTFQFLQPSDAKSIDDHVLANAGAGIAFDWFFWDSFHWLFVPVGTGDGTTKSFTLPGKLVSDLQVFYGTNTPCAVATISPGTGAQGEDVMTLCSAPPNGFPIWANMTARRRFTVTYEVDSQPLTRLADTGYFTFQTRLVQAK